MKIEKLGIITVNTFSLLSFLLHFIFITINVIYPRETVTRLEKHDLNDIEFPIVFKICVDPAFDKSGINNLGYKDIFGYFAGRSVYDQNNFGWAGHHKNGSTIFKSAKGKD